MLPTFIVIGAMKGGTTSLHLYLSRHPEIAMSRRKELNFFVAERNWERGVPWYEEQFDALPRVRVVGESSPNYSKAWRFPGVPSRMASVLPDVKLIYVVRDPIARMRSQYRHEVAAGTESTPFEEAVRKDPEYVDNSCYASQLECYLEHFDRRQILVLTSERLRVDRQAALRDVYRFVGVDANLSIANITVEANQTALNRRRFAVVEAAKGKSWFRTARRLTPAPLRRAFRQVTSLPVDAPTGISATLEAELRATFQPGVQRLRQFLPPEWDGWGLDSLGAPERPATDA